MIKLISMSILAVIFFSGCAQTISSEITVFHKLPMNKNNETIYYSFKKSKEDTSLENQIYLKKLEDRLKLFNFIQNENEFDYIVNFEYSIDNGTSIPYSRATPIYGQTGGGSKYVSGYVNGQYASGYVNTPATYGVVNTIASSGVNTIYKRLLKLKIYSKTNSEVYSAKVISDGSDSSLIKVIDEMLDGLFKEFPGDIQQSRTEKIQSQDNK